MRRFYYAFGYKSRELAEAALVDCFAEGTVSEGEKPVIKSYQTKKGTRWGIEVAGE